MAPAVAQVAGDMSSSSSQTLEPKALDIDAAPIASSPKKHNPLPLDSEGKSKTIRIWSFCQPHMMAFHLSWLSFFMSFVATFAPAALLPVIRDDLNLTKSELGNAGVAAVCGAIGARIFMGVIVDVVGPRYATAATMLVTAPAVFCMSLVTDFSTFAAVRFFIGCSLCMFVCCQFWCGTMFNVRIVGTANAIAAGWGNMGGGATQFIMPLLYEGIKHTAPGFQAWRWAFFIPGGIYILNAVSTLMWGIDHPSGKDYRDLKKEGALKTKGALWPVIKCGLTNYRGWILALTYGYSFGVELTVDNVIAEYMFDQFGLSLTVAGALGSIFGLMNLFTRATGGMISDIVAKYWGMRGRIWALWIIQTLGGLFCVIMGLVANSLTNTIIIMIVFSIFCQQACGAHFGITPFVSRRAYGVVSGIVGAGGNVGAAVTQAIWFAGKADWQLTLTKPDAYKWMGIQTIVLTLPLFFIVFPMWGSMLTGPREGATEEDYYMREWSAEEVADGLHHGSMKFAMESKSQRGYKDRAALEAVAEDEKTTTRA
ncbi:High affinity nitrate transporter 2.5 [Tetrabaena socialis]|uniref:Nitrate/nitrite transporter n=1 Tax=Tetrabaena socialis TaxID=47790 RepID=A0A2J8AE91_9CHLO|nr:High affinity nitrate transporter 2.5 [Tetrabaena socialis]|eukprot:PNH10816.1 High affinity nitrate transporter 2.5 [Tetrabaena socialis]